MDIAREFTEGIDSKGSHCDIDLGLFSKRTGLEMGELIEKKHLLELILHPEGGLKNIKEGIKKILFLNQADANSLATIASSADDEEDVLNGLSALQLGVDPTDLNFALSDHNGNGDDWVIAPQPSPSSY